MLACLVTTDGGTSTLLLVSWTCTAMGWSTRGGMGEMAVYVATGLVPLFQVTYHSSKDGH